MESPDQNLKNNGHSDRFGMYWETSEVSQLRPMHVYSKISFTTAYGLYLQVRVLHYENKRICAMCYMSISLR